MLVSSEFFFSYPLAALPFFYCVFQRSHTFCIFLFQKSSTWVLLIGDLGEAWRKKHGIFNSSISLLWKMFLPVTLSPARPEFSPGVPSMSSYNSYCSIGPSNSRVVAASCCGSSWVDSQSHFCFLSLSIPLWPILHIKVWQKSDWDLQWTFLIYNTSLIFK